MKVDEKILFSLSEMEKLLDGFYKSYKEVGNKNLFKDDADFIKNNLFLIKMNLLFMNKLKGYYFIRFSNELQGLDVNTSQAGINYLALVSLSTMIPRICYIIHKNPSSELVKNLIKNKTLIAYYTNSGEKYVKVNWKAYTLQLKELMNDLQSLIETTVGGVKNEQKV